jgi:hypothetical protein
MKTLPRSLQQLISEARRIVDERESEPDPPEQDPIMQGVDDWLVGLSRGEFDQELYWQCQAEDCEEDGDWEGAIAANRQIVGIEFQHGISHSLAHRRLSWLFDLLGYEASALHHCQLATHVFGKEVLETLHAEAVVGEVWQLLGMQSYAAASQRIDQLLAEPIDWGDHCFSYAHVCLTRAACRVAEGRGRDAKKHMVECRRVLDDLSASLSDTETEMPPGILNMLGAWWLVQAERNQLIGDLSAELYARRESLKIAEQLASDDPLSVVHAEYSVMRRQLALAAACDRQGLAEEAAKHRVRADQICVRRKFPEESNRVCSLQPAKRLSVWQQLLNRF